MIGATGRAPTDRYKVSATYPDGFRLAIGVLIGGEQAARKGERVARALVDKVERLLEARGLGRFRATQIDALGAEASYGPHARARDTREVVMRIAASHADRDALKLLVRELPQAGTSMAPGFATLVGGQPDPATMIKLFSFLIEKSRVPARVEFDGQVEEVSIPVFEPESRHASTKPLPDVCEPPRAQSGHRVPLISLAHGRSGDKGDHSNIGIIARESRFAPLLAQQLTAEAVAKHMAHVLDPVRGRVTRYSLPGCNGWNFLLEHALGGGGVASLRADPQGKAFAQQLLAFEISVPEELFRQIQDAAASTHT
jgi:plasmid stabilization system protein ParE